MAAPLRPVRPPTPALIIRGFVATMAARYRLVRVVAVATLALLIGAVVDRAQRDAEQAVAAWEPSLPVLVARHDLASGTLVTATAVFSTPVPTGLVPADAVTEIGPATRTRTQIVAGEILRAARLHPGTVSPTAARIPDGTAALTVDGRELPAEVGDVVQVYDLYLGQRLVAAATVVGRDDEHLTIAVPIDRVGAVVASLGAGGVVVTLVDTPQP